MFQTESRSLNIGSTVIKYTLRRSTRRRKTVEIAVDRIEGVLIAAPAGASDLEIETIMRRRASWIIPRLKSTADGKLPTSMREWITGETFLYLGRHYRMRFVSENGSGKPPVRLSGRWLEIQRPSDEHGPADHRLTEAVEDWYRRRAARKLRQRVDLYARRLGVEPKEILIRSQTRRWGSCGQDGTLRFNWRIVMAPLSVLDYVVVHELSHLRCAHHRKDFWRVVASVLPDFELARQRLKREGSAFRLA